MTTIDTHRCEEFRTARGEDKSLAIVYSDASNSWVLSYRSYADEEDVKMEEAEQVGELIFSLEVAIAFCPYCGEKLLNSSG